MGTNFPNTTVGRVARPVACMVCLFLGAGLEAADDTLYVAPGSTYVLAANETHATNDIRGTLVVPSGRSISATENLLGTTGDGVITVQGGTYGKVNTTSALYRFFIGTGGGTGAINLTAAKSALKGGDFTIESAAAAHASGYIDVLTGTNSGNKTFSVHHRHNLSSHTARIRVFGGRITDNADSISYYDTRFQRGPWLIEIEKDAFYQFNRNYRDGSISDPDVPLTVRGEGTLEFNVYGGDGSWSVNRGVVIETRGGLVFVKGGKPLLFADGVVFGDDFGPMAHDATQPIYFGGDVNLSSLTTTSTGRFAAQSGKSPTLTFGRGDRDVTFTGPVFAEGCGLTLVKTGAGTLTSSATTTFLPPLALDAGELVIAGATSCSDLTMAAGTSVTVDGGTWTINGAQLTQAVGSTIQSANGGKIIVKRTGAQAPSFADGATVYVCQYWIDGVKQPNGKYALGGATLVVYEYVEPTEIWTNAGKSGSVFSFPDEASYKGFDLVTTSAPLRFAGGPVVLGSSGIVVESTANAATFGFETSLYAPVDQTWAFGAASAVFSRPFILIGSQCGKVTMTSTGDIVLASTNSTFGGKFDITAGNITVSGYHPFGVGKAKQILRTAKTGKIVLQDLDLPQDFGFVNSRADPQQVVFKGVNRLQGMSWNDDGCNAMYAAGSDTAFAGAVTHYNYNNYTFGSGARLVYRKPVKFWGYAGSASFNAAPANSAAVAPTIRFEAQNTVNDLSNGGSGPQHYTFYLYGKDRNADLRVELAADHAFSRGKFSVQDRVTIDLCGYNQGMNFLMGAGTVTSASSAVIELDVPAGSNNVVRSAFVDRAGLRLVGAGTAKMTGANTTSGQIAVDRGTLEIATPCTNVTAVAVASGGKLIVTAEKAFSKQADVTLAGVGALTLPTDESRLWVRTLTLTNPSTGETVTYRAGEFDSSKTWGLVSRGQLRVGTGGFVVIWTDAPAL